MRSNRLPAVAGLGIAALAALLLPALLLAGSQPTQPYLHYFDSSSSKAQGGMILGPDGNYYGTFAAGGANGSGGLFQLSVDSSGNSSYRVLYSFSALDSSNHNADGGKPRGALAISPDGTLLYGTAPFGGSNGVGTLFSIPLPTTANPSPALSTLASFGASSQAQGFTGSFPDGTIAVGSDGTLYGAATGGGAHFNGQIWKYKGSAGSLYDLSAQTGASGNADGEFPQGLVLGADGNLWGVCQQGGANNAGTVFKVSTGGQYSVAHTYSSAPANSAGYPVNADGAFPLALTPLPDGSGFYVITSYGGSNGLGALGLIATGGGFTVLGVLPGVDSSYHNAGGATPAGPVVLDNQGEIIEDFSYGGANGNGTVSQIVLPSPANPSAVLTLTPLGTFSGLNNNTNADGAAPSGPLLFVNFSTGSASTGASITPGGTRGGYVGTHIGGLFGITGEGGTFGMGGISYWQPSFPPPASVSLYINPNTITLGQNATLSWTSTYASGCFADEAWTGIKPVQGSVNVAAPETGTYTFVITCYGQGGNAQGTTVLTVQEPGSSSGSSSGSGSSGSSGSSSSGSSSASSSGSGSSGSSSGGGSSGGSSGSGSSSGSSSGGGSSSSGGGSTVNIGQVGVATSAGQFSQSGVATTPSAAAGQLGTGQNVQYGFIGFTVSGAAPSSTVNLTITVPLAQGQSLVGYLKCPTTNDCTLLGSVGATKGNITLTGISGNQMTLRCATDATGTCKDPGAPVVSGGSGSGGGGGGAFGASMLAALLLGGAGRRLRGRKRRG